MRCSLNRRPEECAKGEEWAGQCLCRTISRKKRCFLDPARNLHRVLQQGEDDVTAAKDKGTTPIEGRECLYIQTTGDLTRYEKQDKQGDQHHCANRSAGLGRLDKRSL